MEMYSWRVYDGIITLPCQLTLRASHPVLKPMGGAFQTDNFLCASITISMPHCHLVERGWKEMTPERLQNIHWWLFLQTVCKDFGVDLQRLEKQREESFGNQSIQSSSSAVNNYQISFPRKHKSAQATKVLGAPALSSHSNKWQRFSQVNGPTCDHGQGGRTL